MAADLQNAWSATHQLGAVRRALRVHADNGTADSPLARRLAQVEQELSYRSAARPAAPAVPAAPAPQPVADPATERQISYIASLAASKGVKVDVAALTKRSASAKIDELKALPYPKREASPAAPQARVEDGFYKLGDDFVKVQMNLAGTRMYAKRWDGEGWEFEPGLLNKLRPEMKLTSEQASEFGALYGRCIAKGCKLTHETSIRLGYGPVCAEKNGWFWG